MMAVAVAICLLSTFSFLICLIRSKQHKGLINAQLPERAPMASQRATLNYTGIVERTDNSRVETWGSDAGANGSSALRPPVNRGQSQGSTKSLPAYEEEVQNGEVVLVERAARDSMAENHVSDRPDCEAPETSNSIAAISENPAQILEVRPGNSGSTATTATSANNADTDCSDSAAPVVVPVHDAANSDSLYGDAYVPSYDGIVGSTIQTCDITEAEITTMGTRKARN
ncbi:hypothetical protein RHS03_09814, partial [Rhizoctonia solani]